MIELTTISLTLRWQMNNNDTLKCLNAMLKDINGENRPVKFTQGDTIITMDYDYMGRRLAKTVNGNTQLFVYDNYLQIAELNEDSQIVKSYIWDPTAGYASRPLATTIGNDFYYYTHDANKNITELIASNGTIVAHYEYSPFGAITGQLGTLDDPFTFSSEYLDKELGLMYYNYRHYNPTDGRWLSRDPIEEKGGWNLYGMVNNQVIFFTDYNGLFNPLTVAIGAVLGGAVGAITALATGGDVTASIAGGVLSGALVGGGVPPSFALAAGNAFGGMIAGLNKVAEDKLICNSSVATVVGYTAISGVVGYGVGRGGEILKTPLSNFLTAFEFESLTIGRTITLETTDMIIEATGGIAITAAQLMTVEVFSEGSGAATRVGTRVIESRSRYEIKVESLKINTRPKDCSTKE